jgi:hypothetical protein
MGIEDVEIRRQTAAGLWLAGIDVESLCGLGVLCVRLVSAPRDGRLADVVVWDIGLGTVTDLDDMWRRYAASHTPALVIVSDVREEAPLGNVQVCPPEPKRIVASVERALDAQRVLPS